MYPNFSLSETSSLKRNKGGDSDVNPSWINLRVLKDVMRMSATSPIVESPNS